MDHTRIAGGAVGSAEPDRSVVALTVHQVDVFTRTPLAGNPAAVVLHADGLDDGTMQAIAQEMNLSETAFVSRESPPGVVPVRFFTPTREVPVCGHATLGAHFARARHLGLVRGAVMQASPGAHWNVRWERRDGATFVTMRQSPVVYGAIWGDDLSQRLLTALGIDRSALRSDCPVQIVSTGHAKVMVPVRSREILEAIRPYPTALSALSEASGIAGYFLFAEDDRDRDTFTACRMFGPALGIPEDPVNGSGHGPLAAYLLARGGDLSAAARAGFWSRMGDHLGRPGRVWVRAEQDGHAVDVGGFVTPVFSAHLEIGRAR